MRYFIGMLLGVVCLLESVTVLAEKSKSDEEWKYGKIVLNSGRQFEGHLRYNLENNVVVLQSGQQMLAFSAYSVESFMAIDTTSGFTQNFFTLPYSDTPARPRLMFFQLVFDGKFALFVREREVSVGSAATHRYPTRLHPNKEGRAFVQDYFVFLPNGNFQKFLVGRNNLAELFSLKGSEAKQVDRYVNKNNINFSRQPDIIRLIDHYINQKSIAQR